MAQTLVSLLVHVIFSTKNRDPFITRDIEPELFACIGGILKNHESRLLDAGGTADHVHLLISQSKNVSLSSLMKDVKKDSSFNGSKRRVVNFGISIGRTDMAHSQSDGQTFPN